MKATLLMLLLLTALTTTAQGANMYWQHAAFGNRVMAHYGSQGNRVMAYYGGLGGTRTVNYRSRYQAERARRSAYNRARRAHLR